MKNNTNNFIVLDWANNICFKGKRFQDFEDAENFLVTILGEAYDDERGEYFVISDSELTNDEKRLRVRES